MLKVKGRARNRYRPSTLTHLLFSTNMARASFFYGSTFHFSVRIWRELCSRFFFSRLVILWSTIFSTLAQVNFKASDFNIIIHLTREYVLVRVCRRAGSVYLRIMLRRISPPPFSNLPVPIHATSTLKSLISAQHVTFSDTMMPSCLPP